MPVLYEIPWKVMDELLQQQQQDSSDCDEDHACPICGETECNEHEWHKVVVDSFVTGDLNSLLNP